MSKYRKVLNRLGWHVLALTSGAGWQAIYFCDTFKEAKRSADNWFQPTTIIRGRMFDVKAGHVYSDPADSLTGRPA